MDTSEKFTDRWIRGKPRQEKFWFERLPLGLIGAGLVFAFFEDSRISSLSVSFLLTGIALFLWKLTIYAEGMIVDLEYLQEILKEGQDQADNDLY